MRSMLTTWRIFARRGLANWPLLSVFGLGVLVASTLLAAAPVYARVMSDLALTFRIRNELEEAPATEVILRDSGLASADGLALREAVEARIKERLGWFEDSLFRYTVVADFWIRQPGHDEDRAPFAGRLQSFEGYGGRVTVAEGRLPEPGPAGEPIEVALSPASAMVADLGVGDTLYLQLVFDTCERVLPLDEPPPPPLPCDPAAAAFQEFPVVVVGLIEPVDAESEFWPAGSSAYFSPFRRYQETDLVLPLFVPEETVFERLSSTFPGYRPAVTWNVFPEPDKLSRTNFVRAREDLERLADDMVAVDGFAISPLRSTLTSFEREVSHKETPLLILLLEISGVALFYVLLMSLVVVERQAGEIALLRGRGSSIPQVVLMYLFDGLVVGVPVLLAAPLLAALLTALLGFSPSFSEVSDGGMLPLRLPIEAFGLAAVGVILALATLSVPVFFAARRGVVAQKRAEARPGASVIQRYYLDLVLAAVAGLLLWELNERGSVFLSGSSVGLASDPLLLASPVLIIAAAAALLLRFVPLVLRVVSWLAAAGAGVAVAVALWQVVRNPGQYTRLALLLMMAVAVGTFAASYASTTERSYRDRALFESGVEWRAFNGAGGTLGPDGVRADERLEDVEGLERWTAVARLEAAPAVVGRAVGRIQLLAVDPPAAASMIWSRHDFAGRPLPELLGLLGGQDGLGGILLPDGTETLKLWVYSDVSRESVNVWIRIHDENRNYGLVEMGSLEGRGWRELQGAIHSEFGRRIGGPVSIVSILLTEPANRPNPATSPIVFDDLSAGLENGSEALIDDFEADFRWQVLPDAGRLTDDFELTSETVHSGSQAGAYTTARVTGNGVRGFYPVGPHTPVPAIASESFLDMMGASPGQTTIISVGSVSVPIEIIGAYRLFPTLSAADGPSLVVNRDHLEAFSNLASPRSTVGFGEVWGELADGVDREALADALRVPQLRLSRTVSVDDALAEIESNPLIAAGGGGILFVSFVVLLVLVGAALLVSLWVAVQRRRAEFAVLRAMGLSRAQILGQLTCEYAVVAIVGLGAGAYLGILVGRRMLSFLNVTEQGERVEPSFILQTDWAAVLAGGGAVLLAFAAALLLAATVLSRTSDAAALRRD